MRRQVLLTVASILLVAAIATNTGGFATVDADRSVNIAVTSDQDAYLGIDDGHTDGTLSVELTNRFGGDVTLDASVTANGTTETVDSLGPGTVESVDVPVECGTDGIVTYHLEAVEQTGDLRMETNRSVECSATS